MSKIAALINDTSGEYHIGCNTVISNIEKLCGKHKIIFRYRFTRKDLMDKTEEIKMILNDVDLVVVNGEGSLHRGNNILGKILYVLPKNQPSVLINTVWDKMYFEEVRELDKFKFIAVRESFSRDELALVYNASRILIVPDMIFLTGSGFKFGVGFGDSVLPSLIESLEKTDNYFPLQTTLTIPDHYAYMSWLRTLGLYVTGRFHGVCFAAIAEVPFLAFPSNSHKIEGLLKDMNCSDLLIKSFSEIKSKAGLAKTLLPEIIKYKDAAKDKFELLGKKLESL